MFRRSLLLNDNLIRHQIAVFLLCEFFSRLLIKVFNKAISIQEGVMLPDFFLPEFLKVISDDIRLLPKTLLRFDFKVILNEPHWITCVA
jgi:hypothetical protein